MQNLETNIQSRIIKLVEDMLDDWDTETDGAISVDSALGGDLGFASVDFVELVVCIEEEFKSKLGFHDLLMPNDRYVDDLSIEQIVKFVTNCLGSGSVSNTPAVTHQPKEIQQTGEIIDSVKLQEFRDSIKIPLERIEPDTTKNQKAIFILNSPRSGSTLLRTILGGHPKLFAPPELHLLDYRNLSERKAALSNDLNSHLLEGTIRAIMQVKNYSAAEAELFLEDCENKQLTTKQFYNILQQGLDGKILVDKTPTYATHVEILKRAEDDFLEPFYIHLVRHPYGMIRSFTDAKIDLLVPFLRNSSFSRQNLAELTWIIAQQNIQRFLQEVPESRSYQVKFEDLVQQPASTVDGLCRSLGIDFHHDMLDPYKEKDVRMTDGVYAASRFSGDLKFHLHRSIEPEVANRWQQFHSGDFLSEITLKLAASFGYDQKEEGL